MRTSFSELKMQVMISRNEIQCLIEIQDKINGVLKHQKLGSKSNLDKFFK